MWRHVLVGLQAVKASYAAWPTLVIYALSGIAPLSLCGLTGEEELWRKLCPGLGRASDGGINKCRFPSLEAPSWSFFSSHFKKSMDSPGEGIIWRMVIWSARIFTSAGVSRVCSSHSCCSFSSAMVGGKLSLLVCAHVFGVLL